VFGVAVGELMPAVGEQGAQVTGPLYAHHLKMDPNF
jgi:hypothetical protein